jgi:hypothetical protein
MSRKIGIALAKPVHHFSWQKRASAAFTEGETPAHLGIIKQ